VPPNRTVIKPKPERVERFTVWDNYDRHCDELREVGATEQDLADLKEAAKAVESEEEKEAITKNQNPILEENSFQDLTAPHECANGWIIQPPTKPARRWAAAAMMKVTGGDPPDDTIGTLYAVLAGLWVLKMWGEGRADVVMQTVSSAGKLATLLPELEDECEDTDIMALPMDYATAMGFPKKKVSAQKNYEMRLESIRQKCSKSLTAT